MGHRTANGIKRRRNFRPGSYNSRLRTNGRALPFQPHGPTPGQAYAGIERVTAEADQDGRYSFNAHPLTRAAAVALMFGALYGSDSGHIAYAEENKTEQVAKDADDDKKPKPKPKPKPGGIALEDDVTHPDGKPAVTPRKVPAEVPAPAFQVKSYTPKTKTDEVTPTDTKPATQPTTQPNGDYDTTKTQPKADGQPEDVIAPAGTSGSDASAPADAPDVPADATDVSADATDVSADATDVSADATDVPADAQPAVSVDAPKPPKFESKAILQPDGPPKVTIVESGYQLDPKTEEYSGTLVRSDKVFLALKWNKERSRTDVNGGDKYKTQKLAGYVGVDLGAFGIEVNGAIDELERIRTDVTQDTSGGIETTTTTDDEENIDTTNYGAKVFVKAGPVKISARYRHVDKIYELGTTTVADIVNPPFGNIIITTDVETEQERTRDIGVIEISGKTTPHSDVGFYVSGDRATIGDLVQSINGTSIPSSILSQDYLRFGFGFSLDHLVLNRNMAFGLVLGSQWLDTEDDRLQGFETFKGAGHVILGTPHGLFYVNATHTGNALDFDRDNIFADRKQTDANIGVIFTYDSARNLQALQKSLVSQGRNAMGINANSPENNALNGQILSTSLNYNLGRDQAGVNRAAFLMQVGRIFTEAGGQQFKGYQGEMLFRGKNGLGVHLKGRDNAYDLKSFGGGFSTMNRNYAVYINYNHVEDQRSGEKQKENQVSVGIVLPF